MTFAIATSRPLFAARRGRPSFANALSVWKQRRSLAQLDTARLEDLGLTRKQAQREAARPVWDLRS